MQKEKAFVTERWTPVIPFLSAKLHCNKNHHLAVSWQRQGRCSTFSHMVTKIGWGKEVLETNTVCPERI